MPISSKVSVKPAQDSGRHFQKKYGDTGKNHISKSFPKMPSSPPPLVRTTPLIRFVCHSYSSSIESKCFESRFPRCSSIVLSSTNVNPLKLACRVGERGVEAAKLTPKALACSEPVIEAFVNSGSKFDVSVSDASLGLKGGMTSFLTKTSQSMSAKKGCALSSFASNAAPSRCLGFRFKSL